MQDPFADLIPGNASQPLRQIIPPQPKTPPAQTPAQASKDVLDAEAQRINIQNTREQMEERRTKKVEVQSKYRSQIDTATSDMLRVLDRLDRVAIDANDNSGWFETGRSGSFMRSLPSWASTGSGAYDLERDLDLVGANAAIESLMQMRRESPTGAGVGNVALGELQLMKDKFATLDPNQGHDSFLRNIAEGKQEFLDKLKRINPKAHREFVAANKPGIWLRKDGSWGIGKLPSKEPQANQQPRQQRVKGLPKGWSIEEE